MSTRSARLALVVGGGPAPAQRAPVQQALRQFRIEGTLQSNGSLVGEYRETVQRSVDNLPAPPSTAIVSDYFPAATQIVL